MADDKDKGGRPSGEEKVAVTIRLPADLLEEIDALADVEIRNRSAQVEKLLKDSLLKVPASGGGVR
jgi:metal-responsive CopG/Arc/MetJ family transcriptional regulator